MPGLAGETRIEVVALVTSAGGLDALSAVLRALPADLDASVVAQTHLGGQGSALCSILRRRLDRDVTWLSDGELLTPGPVWVCPPRKRLEVLPDGTCSLSVVDGGARDLPHDALLASLAESLGARALAVVLTGMGRDGALGVAALKAAGGLVIAQSEDTAEQPSMPHAAAAAGADLVLPLHEIGSVVAEVVAGAPLPRPRHELRAAEQLFAGPGEIRALARAIDWAATPLGPVTKWSDALRLMIRTALDSAYPMAIWWGPELIQIYNERWRDFLGGSKHPAALGGRAEETWPEIWHEVGPMIDRVLVGEAVGGEDWASFFERNGYREEVYVNFSYSPILDADGVVVGVHNTGWETTQKVVAERRLRALRSVAAETAGARTPQEACNLAATALAADVADVPFALFYLLDQSGQRATLAAVTGLEPGSPAAPRVVNVAHKGAVWPLAQLLHPDPTAPRLAHGGVLVDDLADRFPGLQPAAAAPAGFEAPRAAFLVPLRPSAEEPAVGALVLAISPHRPLDEDHYSFLNLVAGQLGAAIDRAEARRRERQRLDRLAELDRVKTEFFSNISHEFRTPLTLLLAPLEEVLRHPEERVEQRMADLELAHRNARRLLRLVGSLLDFSQAEAGRLRPRFVPTDLATLTADIAALFRAAATAAGLQLTVDARQLPEPVWVDREMWEKIVANLLSNAVKFTWDGTIDVRLRALPQHAELTVSDTGVGIPNDELPYVLKRFHRVRGVQGRTHEGAGIGLALVYELVRKHQGRVRVTSEEGKGTSVTAWIPLGRRVPPDEPAPAVKTGAVAAAMADEVLRWDAELQRGPWGPALDGEPSPRDDLRHRVPGARILVVDDNADMRDYLVRLLGAQWEMLEARNGEEAIAQVRRDPPDLILSDVMMPELDGFALLRAIREDASLAQLPVILVTARAGEETAIEGLLAGADDYVVKPFSARELFARVGGQLELYRIRREAARDDAFRVALIDALRSPEGPEAIRERATDMLRQHLGCARVVFADVEDEAVMVDDPATTSGGRCDLRPWWTERALAMFRAGKTVVISSVAADQEHIPAAMMTRYADRDVGALVNVPVTKNSRWAALLEVRDTGVREWTEQEIHLIEETADRTWQAVQRTRAERDLRASEERAHSIVAAAPVGIAIVRVTFDAAGQPTDVITLGSNPAAQAIAGAESPSVHGYPAQLTEACGRVVQTGRTEEFEFDATPLGRTLHVRLARAGAADTGEAVLIYEDVTDRNRATAALHELTKRLEDQFRGLVDVVGQTVWTTDAAGRVVEDSPSWRALTGQTLEQWVGWGWVDAVHPDDREHAARQWAHATATGTPVDTEFRLRHASTQDWQLTRVRAIPLRKPDGTVRGWLGMNTDLQSPHGGPAAKSVPQS